MNFIILLSTVSLEYCVPQSSSSAAGSGATGLYLDAYEVSFPLEENAERPPVYHLNQGQQIIDGMPSELHLNHWRLCCSLKTPPFSMQSEWEKKWTFPSLLLHKSESCLLPYSSPLWFLFPVIETPLLLISSPHPLLHYTVLNTMTLWILHNLNSLILRKLIGNSVWEKSFSPDFI